MALAARELRTIEFTLQELITNPKNLMLLGLDNEGIPFLLLSRGEAKCKHTKAIRTKSTLATGGRMEHGMSAPRMTAYQSIGSARAQYITAARRQGNRPAKLEAMALSRVTVGMATARFFEQGQKHYIESGRLNYCSFAVVRYKDQRGKLGHMAIHHGNEDIDVLMEKMQAEEKKWRQPDALRWQDVQRQLLFIQHAWDPGHSFMSDGTTQDDTRLTWQELTDGLRNANVDVADVKNKKVNWYADVLVDITEEGDCRWTRPFEMRDWVRWRQSVEWQNWE